MWRCSLSSLAVWLRRSDLQSNFFPISLLTNRHLAPLSAVVSYLSAHQLSTKSSAGYGQYLPVEVSEPDENVEEILVVAGTVTDLSATASQVTDLCLIHDLQVKRSFGRSLRGCTWIRDG